MTRQQARAICLASPWLQTGRAADVSDEARDAEWVASLVALAQALLPEATQSNGERTELRVTRFVYKKAEPPVLEVE